MSRDGEGGTYPGIYEAFVRDTADPQKRARVRLHCPAVMGEEDREALWLDWALPLQSLGRAEAAGESGSCNVPPVGTPVWVAFQAGNPEFPVCLGTRIAGDTSTNSEVPKLAKGEDDGSRGENRTQHGVTVSRSTAGGSDYPYNVMVRTEAGHIVELDGTPSKERIRIRHQDGSFEEYQPNGAVWKQVLGDFLVYVGGNFKVGVVSDIVLGAGMVLIGSATSSGRIVREDRLMSVFNGHTHPVPPIVVAAAGPVAGAPPVATVSGATIAGVTSPPSTPIVSPGDFYTKPRTE